MNNHYEKNKEIIKATSKKWLHEHQEIRMFHCTKQRASLAGLDFTIRVEDIKIPKICPLLGVPITNIFGKGRQQTNASLDRKDSSKGYTPDNIWVISDLANRMKQDATIEQLLSFAKCIQEVYK